MQNDLASTSPTEPAWRDNTVCPDGCPARGYAHKHCQSFGCVMYGQGGGGDDGRGIDCYVDDDGRESVTCEVCGLEACPRCIRTIVDGKPKCYEDTCIALYRSQERMRRLAS